MTDRPPASPLGSIVESLTRSYTACSKINHLGGEPLPSREAVIDVLAGLHEIIYPGFGVRQNLHAGNVAYYVGSVADAVAEKLTGQVAAALRHGAGAHEPSEEYRKASGIVLEFFRALPTVRDTLNRDVESAYRGDPAAHNHAEIIFCYPGLEAITVYRLAHVLYKLGVPYVPRMMTEYAHSKTGIDIHPGAVVGEGFFIDHGTGVVIGQTCHIGRNVRIYQGVTLGALSFPKDGSGELIRDAKRHPTLEDDVIIYANATVLGGDTVVGARTVIGSNVWLTHSVDPDTVVVIEKPQLRLKGSRKGSADEMWYI